MWAASTAEPPSPGRGPCRYQPTSVTPGISISPSGSAPTGTTGAPATSRAGTSRVAGTDRAGASGGLVGAGGRGWTASASEPSSGPRAVVVVPGSVVVVVVVVGPAEDGSPSEPPQPALSTTVASTVRPAARAAGLTIQPRPGGRRVSGVAGRSRRRDGEVSGCLSVRLRLTTNPPRSGAASRQGPAADDGAGGQRPEAGGQDPGEGRAAVAGDGAVAGVHGVRGRAETVDGLGQRLQGAAVERADGIDDQRR